MTKENEKQTLAEKVLPFLFELRSGDSIVTMPEEGMPSHDTRYTRFAPYDQVWWAEYADSSIHLTQRVLCFKDLEDSTIEIPWQRTDPTSWEEVNMYKYWGDLDGFLKILSRVAPAIPTGEEVCFTTLTPQEVPQKRADLHFDQNYLDRLQDINPWLRLDPDKLHAERVRLADGQTPFLFINPLEIEGITFTIGNERKEAQALASMRLDYTITVKVGISYDALDGKKLRYYSDVSDEQERLKNNIETTFGDNSRQTHYNAAKEEFRTSILSESERVFWGNLAKMLEVKRLDWDVGMKHHQTSFGRAMGDVNNGTIVPTWEIPLEGGRIVIESGEITTDIPAKKQWGVTKPCCHITLPAYNLALLRATNKRLEAYNSRGPSR